MPGTIFGIPFDDELFLDMWREAQDPYLTAMIESGAVVEDSTIAEMIQGRGNIYTIPFYNTLDGEDMNYEGCLLYTSNPYFLTPLHRTNRNLLQPCRGIRRNCCCRRYNS